MVPAPRAARHTHAGAHHHRRARQLHLPPQEQKGFTKTSETTSPEQDSQGHPHAEMAIDTVMLILETAQEVESVDRGRMISTHVGQPTKPCSTAARPGFLLHVGEGNSSSICLGIICDGEPRLNWGRLCPVAQAGSATQSHQG